MDVRGSAGNPGPTSPDSHPAPPDHQSLQAEGGRQPGGEEVCLSGSNKDHSPAEKDQQLQYRLKNHQNPPKKHQRLQSSAEEQQSPAKKLQSHTKNHQSPAQVYKTDHSPAEVHQMDQSPAEDQQTDQSLAEVHETDQSPVEVHKTDQRPAEVHQMDQSPAEAHETDQSQAEVHQMDQSPAEDHQTDQSLVEVHETDQSPAEVHKTDQSPAEAHETDQSPAEVHQMDQSPAEDHQTDQSLVEVHKTDQRPAEVHQLRLEAGQFSGHHQKSLPDQQKPEDFASLKEPKSDQVEPKGSASAKQDLTEPDHQSGKPGGSPPTQDVEGKLDQEPDQVQNQSLKRELNLEPRPGLNQEPSLEPKQELHGESRKDQEPDQAPYEQTKQVVEQHTELSQDHQNQNTEQTPPPCEDHQNYLGPPTKGPPPPLTNEASCDLVQSPVVAAPDEPKLCGFLQKQGGPLRAWKQRWFTYEENKNQLFYYRTPQDVTPLGRVELSGATLTYPLDAEKGTFHIKTPERTFVLKAVSQELRLYWLQQLQLKRWQHQQVCNYSTRTHSNNNSNNNNKAAGETQTNNTTTDDFLPVLSSPVGLVGEEAARSATQRTPLADVSIKHPLIHLQNSVHSLMRRSSQEVSRSSVFHVETPTGFQPGQRSPLEGRDSSSPLSGRRGKSKTPSLSSMSIRRRDVASSDQTSRLLQENQTLMEEVKAQKELVWILHRALEAAQLEKRTCAEFLAVEDEQERLEVLRHRERQAVDLRRRLEEAEVATGAARRSAAQKEAQVVELQEDIRTLMEKNSAKQEVIIKLSEHASACLSDHEPQRCPTLQQLQQEAENLKDDIEAYKIQNKFLNSEILQLTKLWRTSSEQEKNLMVKCAHLEATNCQVESRYLGVLRKLQETKSLDRVQQEAVQDLIQEALKGELSSVLQLSSDRDYDEYGFKIVPDYEVEDIKLLAKIQALEIRSHNLLHQEAAERPLLGRWAQYLASRLDEDLCPSPELKVLVRGGVPPEYRPRVWRWMVRARTRTIRDHHPQHYQQLCEKSRTSLHPASRQIQLDLHRTLTTNQNFSSPSSPALPQLRRILLAFSWHNPVIGYCQGLNRLAAMSLLVLQSEEEAFWCLVAVVESIMPQDYYTKSLVASQADQQVLKDLMVEKLPRLAAHFEEHNVDVSLVTFNWFLVVFVESLPSDILLPVWDAFLYEGTKVMFRYALALFKYKEEDFCKIRDSVEIYQYLRFFTKTISDTRKLTCIAFSDMNPFPRRQLRNRRVVHLERLQGELCELEAQQREFLTESAEHRDKDVDTAASEDDDDL